MVDGAETNITSFRALDVLPGGSDIIAGTHRCDIWEIANDKAEPLIQGHSADVYGLSWHPLKPYRFVTASEGSNVYLYHAKRRVLLVRRFCAYCKVSEN